MNHQKMNNELRIIFTDEAWEKLEKAEEMIKGMMANEFALFSKIARFAELLKWFYNNQNQFHTRKIINKTKFSL